MRPRFVRLLSCAALLLGASCQLTVGDELGAVRCELEGVVGAPACAAGYVCMQGACTRCSATEVCGDGLDNDCNGVADDQCAAADAGVEAAADAYAVADDAGAQQEAGSPFAKACKGHADCGGALCADWKRDGSSAICTQTCCKSEHCPEGAVCVGMGGGNVCVPAKDANRATPGKAAEGQKCSKGSDCRSGLCRGVCQDSCCHDADCSTGTCAALQSTEHQGLAWQCRPDVGLPADSYCKDPDQCRSNVCGELTCLEGCCKQADCLFPIACDYRIENGTALAVCDRLLNVGARDTGASCTDPSDCIANYCINGYCSSVCCTDVDCPTGMRCAPHAEGAQMVLRCVRME